jgi:hypothetical protein
MTSNTQIHDHRQTISSQFRSECKPILYLQYLFYNVCILCLSRSVKQSKTTARLSEKSGNKLCFYWFQLCLLSRPCTYCYRFLHEPVLDIKALLGQWLNSTEAYLAPLLPLFSDNLAVVLDCLTLRDKHNIHTL